jgi:NOL1/NOP2/fmu family ribosome biogenesis protein
LWRRDQHASAEWSTAHVQLCAARQQRILKDAVRLLAPGGLLLYSTCTYNLTENDENAAWIAANYGLEVLQTSMPEMWGVSSRSLGYQCYPHKVQGEGFYVCGFRKQEGEEAIKASGGFRQLSPLPGEQAKRIGGWGLDLDYGQLMVRKDGVIHYMPESQIPNMELLDQGLIQKQLGLVVGQFKGKDFIPSPELALSIHLQVQQVPQVSLDLDRMKAFLKRNFDSGEHVIPGWHLVTFEGLPLGWCKGIQGGRVNNYWPVNWRLLK